jgi:hypothetical protein
MADTPTRYQASDRALLTELGDGTGVLLDMDSKFYFTLNETAIFVWKQLAAPATLDRDELAARVSGEFEVDVADAAKDIDDVLDMLQRERLVTVAAD